MKKRVWPAFGLQNSVYQFLVLYLLLISGCATIDIDYVGSEHSHDGTWMAEIQKTPKYQKSGYWSLECNDMSGEFGFVVDNSVLRLNFLGKDHDTFVSKSGKFKLNVLSSYVAKESPLSDVALDNGEVTYVFKGNLATNRAKGTLVVSIAGLGDRGCRSKIGFAKVEGLGEKTL